MAHSAIELKTKAIKNINAPKGSWVDQYGKRWEKVLFDVMVDGGTRFLRQVSVTLGMHFDFGLGRYCIDYDRPEQLMAEVIRQHPSLGGVRNAEFILTDNKVF